MSMLRERILIVDDEPWNIQVLEKYLASENYEILKAANAAEGLAILERTGAELVLLDVMMPDKDGFEFCREIRRHPVLSTLPVILVTALQETVDKVLGLEAGANDFLSKPVDKVELMARVRAHLRIQALRQTVVEQKGQIQQSLKKLQELSELQNRITLMISHDLRSPLTVMKMGLENLEHKTRALQDETQKKMIGRLQGHVDYLASLVDNILSLGELESGSHSLRLNLGGLNPVVGEVVEQQRPLAEAKQLSLLLQLDAGLPELFFDTQKIIQLVINLVSNAVKYTPAGRVTVSTVYKSEANEVEVRVQDTGPGIKAEDRAKLFGKFTRFDNAYEQKIKGSGLGLAVCHEIVKQHRGRLFVESEEGRGACFVAALPVRTG